MRLNRIANARECSWSIESKILVKSTYWLRRIGTLTVIKVCISVEIRVNSWSKLKIRDYCSDAYCSMLLLLGFKIAMMSIVFC